MTHTSATRQPARYCNRRSYRLAKPMILRNRIADLFEHHGKWLLIGPPLVLLALPAVVISLLLDPEKVFAFYAELLSRDKLADLALPSLLIVPVIWTVFRIAAQSRVELTDSGIRFASGVPEWLRTQTDWELSWGDIQSVELQRPPFAHPLNTIVVFNSGGTLRRLQPWQWVTSDTEKVKLGQMVRGRSKKQHALIAKTPLVTELRSRGKLPAEPNKAPVAENDLRRAGKASITVAVAFVGAVAYFILDSYFGLQEYYAGTPPWQWHFAIGLIATVMVWLALNQAKPGSAEALLVALLFGAGMGLAAYPGLLRLNAWLDQAGLVSHEYTLGQSDTWTTSGEPPDLVFDIGSRYWNQFEPGQVKTFQVRRGGLGFYQINMAPIYQEQKAFYAAKK